MAELASIKKIRSSLKGSITRLFTYTQTLDEDTTVTTDALQVRLKRAQKLFDQFTDIERQIFRLDAEEASQLPEVEENYFAIVAELGGLIRKRNTHEGYISSMADQTMNASQSQSSAPSIKLPKINIPPFSGDYVEWQSFYDLYCTTIHEKDYLTSSQKFQYLKGLLRGEAASLLRHLSITEANYVEALQKLTQRYDRKRHTVSAFIKMFLEQPHINQVNATTIRKLWDTSDEVVRGLKALGPNAEHRDPWLIHILVNKLDSESKSLWAQRSAEKDFPTLKEFFSFLGHRTDTLESVSRSVVKKPNTPQTSKPESARAFATLSRPSCPICSSNDHKIFECVSFKEMDNNKRWELIRQEKRCFNCLNFSHGIYNCKSRVRCRQCNKKHHTLLHSESEKPAQTQPEQSASNNVIESKIMQVSAGESQVILPTALVRIDDEFGEPRVCRALLDSASQESFITEECAQNLGLPRRNGRLLMKGLGDAKLGSSRGKMELSIRQVDAEELKVCAFIVPRISAKLPSYDFEISHWSELENVSLADPKFNQRSEIDVLLGTEVYYQVTQGDKIKLEDRLVAEKTSLGWIVAGRKHEREVTNQSACFSIIMNIDDSLRKFWEIESVATASPFTAEEQKCEELFIATTKRANDGKFVVQLPFREPEGQLGSTYHLAMSRLVAMEKRFKRDTSFHQLYSEFMTEYERLGHMSEIPTDINAYYLPHHGVLKSASTTTKLRVVFDASATSSTGVSLNKQLCIGPTIQSTLVDIILRFRQHRFVVTGDIEKMYRQIWVSEADTKYQRILWRQDPRSRPKTFRLKTLTYGTARLQITESETEWPIQASSFGTNEESKYRAFIFKVCMNNDILSNLVSKHSSFFKMKRILAYVLRFTKNIRSPPKDRNLKPLNRDDVSLAAMYLIQYTQQQHFHEEVECLQSQTVLPKSSQLRALNPYIDSDGVIRVGGRLEYSTLATSTKHPILLPRKSEITTAILQDIHHQFYHAGISFMLNFLRQQFWVVRARDEIRQMVRRCVRCFKQKPLLQQQLMGDLPSARVEYVHPFHKVGLDYAGPFKVQITRRRGQVPVKTYICIFVCLSTKAVHIECVSNLTTENFLGALSRFIDRRGLCSDLFSDNGTNFVGANRQLIELFDFLNCNTNQLSSSLLKRNINWHFIPAGSPTMGGIWEAAVKSTKTHLKRVVGETILTLEEFTTLMTGIEAMLNSRPLCATASEEIEVLTPGHFLIGRPLSSLPERSIQDNYCLSKRWDMVKRIKQHFWHRWHRDYLTTLQVRNKWKDKSPNLQINDIIIIRDEQLPPTQWALGRVTQIHPGNDGYVRVASIKTAAGNTKKHISKLCKLPIN